MPTGRRDGSRPRGDDRVGEGGADGRVPKKIHPASAPSRKILSANGCDRKCRPGGGMDRGRGGMTAWARAGRTGAYPKKYIRPRRQAEKYYRQMGAIENADRAAGWIADAGG